MERYSLLGEDVLVEILCKVPDKALVRLKSVSKAWSLLICEICINPNFSLSRPRPVVGLFFRICNLSEYLEEDVIPRVTDHGLSRYFSSDGLPLPLTQWRKKSLVGRYASLDEDGDGGGDEKRNRSAAVVVFGWEECVSSYGLPFCPDPGDFLGCCNGLLLFVNINNNTVNQNQYYVSNPWTRQCVSIPPLPLPYQKQKGHVYLFAALAFDPDRSPHFKIVRFEMLRDRPEVVLDVYSSAQGSWTRHSVTMGLRFCKNPCIRAATYFEGALFRLSQYYGLIRFGDFDDFATVRRIPLPLSYGECQGIIGCVGVLMGELCYGHGYGGVARIWSLHDHDRAGTWELRNTVNISDDLSRGVNRAFGFDCSKWVEPVAFHPNANVIYLGSPLVVLAYDLENDEFEVLFRNEDDHHQFLPASYYPTFPYVRHLAPFPTPDS
ncbi:hypothetical protein C2S51_033055 [Perilla frutescens var. frutescens]|nr:hypothetical protein C2S51_033055 [Perilla frutescens var. frutescens]